MYFWNGTGIFEIVSCPACGGDGCDECGHHGNAQGPDVSCPNPRCHLAITAGGYEADPNCTICAGSGVKGETRHWRQLEWMQKPPWVSDDRRPYFGPKALSPYSQSAEIVHLKDPADDDWWEPVERVNLRSDPTDPAYRLAVPVRIVEGREGKPIKFSNEYDDQRHTYRDVRVIDYPP